MKEKMFYILIVFLLGNCGTFIKAQENIFGFGDYGSRFGEYGLSVVIDNKVKFYGFNEVWVGLPEFDFILPNSYKNIFVMHNSDIGLLFGVVIDNKVKLYGFDDDVWIEVPGLEGILPNGYKNVLGIDVDFGFLGDIGFIGVVVDDKIKFYYFNMGGFLSEMSEIEFVLPNGYKNVYISDVGEITLGVLVDDKVKFYELCDGGTWVEILESEFNLR